nr:late blight resistance protein R1-A-like [Ipomoea trifida]
MRNLVMSTKTRRVLWLGSLLKRRNGFGNPALLEISKFPTTRKWSETPKTWSETTVPTNFPCTFRVRKNARRYFHPLHLVDGNTVHIIATSENLPTRSKVGCYEFPTTYSGWKF